CTPGTARSNRADARAAAEQRSPLSVLRFNRDAAREHLRADTLQVAALLRELQAAVRAVQDDLSGFRLQRRIGPEDHCLTRSMGEDPCQILEREARAATDRRRNDYAVEMLDVPQTLEGVDRRASAFDPGVHGNSRLRGSVLDRLEEWYRLRAFLLHRRFEWILRRDEDQVRRHERGVLGS